jgi:hypothetical protein
MPKAQNKRDEVLKRMLKTPPKKHADTKKKREPAEASPRKRKIRPLGEVLKAST